MGMGDEVGPMEVMEGQSEDLAVMVDQEVQMDQSLTPVLVLETSEAQSAIP